MTEIARRDFLKTVAVAASAAAVSSVVPQAQAAAAAKGGCLAPLVGVVYTKKYPGQWAGKEAVHIPEVKIAGGKVSVVTNHPSMTAEHFIVRHTVVLADGTVIGTKTFAPGDKPESSFDLPKGKKGKGHVTSFCNQHDFWMTEFTI